MGTAGMCGLNGDMIVAANAENEACERCLADEDVDEEPVQEDCVCVMFGEESETHLDWYPHR